MKFSKLKELNVWNESMKLAAEIYKTVNASSKFTRDFGLKEQIQRSAVSIPSNIAEGFERETNAEFIRFLYIAKGSCAELKTQIIIAKEISYIIESKSEELIETCDHISVMVYRLIEYLKKIVRRKS
jgi:four helix bundle protein